MKEEYVKDLQDIKSIMAERSRFLSLSGLSGIMAGIYALSGAALGYWVSINSRTIAYYDIQSGQLTPVLIKLIGIAGLIVILSLVTALFFSKRKASQRNESLWTSATKKMLKSFLVPFITGGILVLIMIWKQDLFYIASMTLVFYGLSLHSASQYTVKEIGSLGLAEIFLGLLAFVFPGSGLVFWAIGFGVLHIICGIIMHYKYDNK